MGNSLNPYCPDCRTQLQAWESEDFLGSIDGTYYKCPKCESTFIPTLTRIDPPKSSKTT